MGNELGRSSPGSGTSPEDLQRMLSWCVTQSMRLDDQFTQTRSILLSSSPLPASLQSVDQSQLLSATVSHVQPLLQTVDALLNNADPTQAALPPSSAIAGYSLTSPFANMTGLASNVHEESNSASVGSGSGTRERGVPVLTSAHASCLERMDVAHKHLVLQAMISKMIKAAVHTLKLRERERYAAARTSGRRSAAATGGGSRDLTDAEYARLTEALRSCGDQLSRVMARLDAAKETLEWLWRDYRLCTVSHSVNETLRVLRGIQRKWAGRTPYVYPRKLGMGDGGAGGAAASARPGHRRSSASAVPPSTSATPSNVTSPSSPPVSIFPHSTQSPLSPVLSLHTGPQPSASSSAFTFSPINSPPQRQMPPPIPPHLLPSSASSQSSSSLLSGQLQPPPPPPPPPPSAVGASPYPASIMSPSIQSMNSIYSSTTSYRHPPPTAPVSDVYDLRFWIHELERRQRLLDYAAQANERSALVSALRTMDESFTASVSSFKVANMSPRLVTLLQLQHKAFLYRDDLRRAIVNMNARLTTLDTAITKLKEESFRLYKGSGREVDISRNTEQMQVVMGEAQTEKRACRDMFKFFHAAVAQHVYSRLEQEVTLQAVDVHALYRELQKVERACLAMFGHVSAEPPHLMFSLGHADADDTKSRSSNTGSASIGTAGQSSVPRKVIVHYDKDKQGEIEHARFSPHAVAELMKQKHAPAASGAPSGGGGGGLLPPPQLSPVGRRVMKRIGSDGKEEDDGVEYGEDDMKDDGRSVGASSNVSLMDEDGDEKEERKEIIIRQSAPLRSSPHSTSTSISRPMRPAAHARARSESARNVTDAAAERINLMEFMRRRQAGGGDSAVVNAVVVSSAERKERERERERDREREPSTASVDSQSSNRGRERNRGSRPPSVDWSPDRHLSMPAPAMMEQSVSPTAAASRGLSPIRPQLPPRPRRASSGATEESAAALRSPPAADGGEVNASSLPPAEAAVGPSLPPNVTPIAVISPPSSSPTGATAAAAARPVPPPLPASYQPPQPAEAAEEPLMTLQQLLAKAQAASPPVPPPPVQPTASSPSAAVSSPIASYPQSASSRASPVASSTAAYLSPSARSNSPVTLSAIPRRFNAASYSPPPPRLPSSLISGSRSEASPSPTRIPVMSPPRAAPLSSSAEAAIVLRNTAMNRSEYERLPAKGMENLSVRERILRLQQRKEEEEAQQAEVQDDDGSRRGGKEEADYSRIKLRPVAPPRLSDSQVRRSLDTAAAATGGRAGVGGSSVASHSRHRSTPNLPSALVSSASGSELVSAPLPPLDGLPQHSVMSMQLSPATRELLQRGGQRPAPAGDSSFFYGKDAQSHTVYVYNTQQQ